MIAIGQIARSNGIRGEVRVNLLTESPERLRQLTLVWIGRDDATAQQFRIEHVRLHRGQAVVKFGSIESRDAADGLKNLFIFIEEQNAAVLPKGTYFIHDIVGMEVLTEEGVRVGCVEEVWQLPANDVWVVREDGKEILLPAIRDVIRTVDVRRKRIVIRPLEGLLE
jgi:16S rRNA processing protein RimM